MRYKVTIEYDGTNFLGWQRQQDGLSIEQSLEDAIFAFSQQQIEVFGAGRTDAGVHALAQVAHFDLETKSDCFRIREALNAHLRDAGRDISILEVTEADADFHARFSATKRSYIYKIINRRAPSVLMKNRAWWIPLPLDVEKMKEGAKYFLGNHDFTSFRASLCQALSPIKTLDKFEIIHKNNETITCYIEAKSFLHHQVRNMVGTLKMVGDGTLQPQDIQKILEAKDRTKAGPTAPAHGLYLNKISY